ncbi:hypothetical protein G7Z17_g3144 [Cylindrodendrum hubeiense]|uniref:FAD/NAD(P)-binding domain-containing protein n=1 Tax=Cylindrodendrum hubeiense TaxID=595255 RepID=A0A9P5HF66_9HYPO|nr:hypothetical protein G7Z17_g3144 [Cylindrodendrum hubeiense]
MAAPNIDSEYRSFGPGIKVAVIGAGICNYPSERPSVSDSPSILPSDATEGQLLVGSNNQRVHLIESKSRTDLELAFAPPSACYPGLTTNIPTNLMFASLKPWIEHTDDYVGHSAVEQYLQELSQTSGVNDVTIYKTRVEDARKIEDGKGWRLRTITLDESSTSNRVIERAWDFDALVVASGHYNLAHVPNIPGLSELKTHFPDRIIHSKEYREAETYKGKSVFIVGGGVSAMDIGREITNFAKSITQSTRSGEFDLPEVLLTKRINRVGGVSQLSVDPKYDGHSLRSNESIPAKIYLQDGTELQDIDRIILATGYLNSYPFLPHLHSDDTCADEVGDDIIIGAKGDMVHNLHKDVFYIEDPSLAFVGVPYHVVTFSTYDYQAQVVAQVFSGKSRLPTRAAMKSEYDERVKTRGHGRRFQSLMDVDLEIDIHCYISSHCFMVEKPLPEIGVLVKAPAFRPFLIQLF